MPWFDRNRPPHYPLVRKDHESSIVFLTVCSGDRKSLFANPPNADLFVRAWRDAGAWRVGRYVIMPDDVHLFCSPATCPPTPLFRWVAFWKSWMTCRWPRAEEKPIFQRDFWDMQLRSAHHYSARWEYVRQNPVRAGLVSSADEWPFQGELEILRG